MMPHFPFVFSALPLYSLTLQRIMLFSFLGSDQSKEVIFPESDVPSFFTVPGEGFAEPFGLTPGKWIIHIRAEGVLLVSF